MTFRQMRLSLFLMAEERVGARRYHDAVEAKANEDRAAVPPVFHEPR